MDIGVIVLIAIFVIIGVCLIPVIKNLNRNEPESEYRTFNVSNKQTESQSSESETLEQLKTISRNTTIIATIIVVFTILWTLGAIIYIVS
ncbi:MAG: hypothetical protein OXC92_01605 [Flavobacteriaceae bacterium]|nr:hypothetical protein [Flavobacteriaceae bacterium]MCY4254020.1 hypothetical protein [Flavobacteriaceae bacterium]